MTSNSRRAIYFSKERRFDSLLYFTDFFWEAAYIEGVLYEVVIIRDFVAFASIYSKLIPVPLYIPRLEISRLGGIFEGNLRASYDRTVLKPRNLVRLRTTRFFDIMHTIRTALANPQSTHAVPRFRIKSLA